MSDTKKAERLNKIFKVINHTVIIIAIIGAIISFYLIMPPFEKKLDLDSSRFSLDDLFQQAKNTALELKYRLVTEDIAAREAEFEKKATGATCRLLVGTEAIEDYNTGTMHHWVKVKVQNEGLASRFNLPSPSEVAEEFFSTLDSLLMEFFR